MNREIEKKIQHDIIRPVLEKKYDLVIGNIPGIIDKLYANIPDNKCISYGRVYTIKVLSEYLYNRFIELGVQIFEVASNIFNKSDDFKSKGVSLGVLSLLRT
ncbi:MAG: hypothetical protein ISS81_08330 [Candidatus Marinimicrobia bacterium]|nr:hypothetical protein [Candidatus Neomarinimicrobiota bacterium]